ncbi:MAG: type II toxin-antitoxin system VapC family toxin [Acidobacteria bacterium]|nr:type II toxin-antitoxin system VapC family toxin [Acidobacteriota bacterium]
MIAVDTNILVYAHRADSSRRAKANRIVTGPADGSSLWSIPWPCLHEFLAIATHPRIYDPPTPLADALRQIQCWMESPTLVMLGEGEDFFPGWAEVLSNSGVAGAAVLDARVAAICLRHGVEKLFSADRDFSRFADLRTENPLLG